MIMSMRRYLQGYGFKIIMFLMLFAMGVVPFFGGTRMFRRSSRGEKSDGRTVITVNNEPIREKDFERTVAVNEDIMQSIRRQYGQHADMIMHLMGIGTDVRKVALESTIRNTLINQATDALAIPITSGYIEAIFSRPGAAHQELYDILPASLFERDGSIRERALSVYMNRMGITGERYDRLIEEALARHMTLELAGLGYYVPGFVVQEAYIAEQSRKKFSLYILDHDQFVKQEAEKKPSAEAIKKFFDEENKRSQRYYTPEKRTGIVWVFDATGYGIQPSEQDIAAYYEEHKNTKFVESPSQIQVRTIVIKDTNNMAQAKKIYEDLLATPSLFAKKASELSEDQETAKQGGLMPFFAKGTQDAALDKAAFLLKADNDIAEPITTKRGIEIIQRVARKAAIYKPLASVSDEIKKAVATRSFKDAFAQDMATIIDNDEDRLNIGKNSAFLALVTSKKASQKTIVAESDDKTAVGARLFKIREKDGYTHTFDGDTACVVQLTGIDKKRSFPLATVQDRVTTDLQANNADKAFNEGLKKLTSQVLVGHGEKVDPSITVKKTDWIKPSDVEAIKKVLDGVHDVPPSDTFMKLEKIGSVGTYRGERHGYVIRVDDIEPVEEKAYSAASDAIKAKLMREYNQLTTAGFVASLYKNVTIDMSGVDTKDTTHDTVDDQADYYL